MLASKAEICMYTKMARPTTTTPSTAPSTLRTLRTFRFIGPKSAPVGDRRQGSTVCPRAAAACLIALAACSHGDTGEAGARGAPPVVEWSWQGDHAHFAWTY